MNSQLPGTTTDEDIKRISRILQLIQVIAAAPRRCSRRDLADRFGVSERMITKDLDIIRHGLRLDLQRTPTGYYLREAPRLPMVQYSFGEALALLNAVQLARRLGGAGGGDLVAAVARLQALFAPEFMPLLHQLDRPLPQTAQGKHRQEMLTLLNRALLGQRVVEMIYATASRGGEITQRRVRPYAFIPYDRSWQLVAFCELRQAVLLFKVDRIREARLLDTPFTLPEDFDLETYMGSTWGILRSEAPAEEVILHFSADAGRWVAEEEWHPSQAIEPLPGGELRFRVCIPITEEFVHWVVRYGAAVEVVAPLHLRRAVRDEHLQAAERNRLAD